MSGLEMTIFLRVYLMPEIVLVIWHLLSLVLKHSCRKSHFIPFLQIRKLMTNKLIIWLYSYSSTLDSFIKKKHLFFILAVLGPHCCAWAPSSCSEQELLIAAASAQSAGPGHRRSAVAARRPQSAASVVVVHGLGCPSACGIFPGQGLNPCPLHWQSDS